jgi:Holliday junction resolvase-like predicted endonuclease
MKTTEQGLKAEKAAANLLEQQNFEIINRNWKTKICEIDIIARKDDVIYFVEVKYRAGEGQGTGFEYIGPKKMRQIGFAARVWCQNNDWEGDYRLLGAEVSGLNFEDIGLVEID